LKQTDVVERMKEKTRFSTREVELFLKEFKELIYEALENGEKVQFLGFGGFETKPRAERVGRNPRTKEEIAIPASIAPVFKPGKEFKDRVNKKNLNNKIPKENVNKEKVG
jgi:Bacterial nucleoid DNA-binding protein